MNPLRNERGFSVLLISLMVLLVMTALASAMMMTTIRETKAVNRLKLSTQAFYSAESGINIAAAEINGSDPTTLESAIATAVTDYPFYFDAETYNLGMTFETAADFVWDGEDPGTIMCYGYKKDGNYVFVRDTRAAFEAISDCNLGRDYWPIFVLTSIGKEGNNKK